MLCVWHDHLLLAKASRKLCFPEKLSDGFLNHSIAMVSADYTPSYFLPLGITLCKKYTFCSFEIKSQAIQRYMILANYVSFNRTYYFG